MDGPETTDKGQFITATTETIVDQVSISIETAAIQNPLKLRLDWAKVKKSLSNVGLWLGFGVSIGLTPVLSSWLVSGAIGQKFSLQNTFGNGSLLAISIALMGEAMGYLLTNPKVHSAAKGMLGLSCTLNLLAAAFLLGVLTISKLNFDTAYITNVSYFLFGITLIIGSLCKWTEK